MGLTTSVTSSPSVGSGWQRPRICHVPEYVSSAGAEAIALAALAGLHLDEWQQFVLQESLGEVPGGRWSAQTVGLVVGRQNGKGSILEARELFGLFILGEQLIVHTAHRQKIATNHYRRMRKLIERTPRLHSRVAGYPAGKGSEAIVLKDGRRIEFTTRQSGNARGLTADLIVYDEAMFLTEDDRSGISPTMSALSISGNIQSWYVGSAVDQEDGAQDGVPFAQVREAGIAGSGGLAYFEWSAADGDPGRLTRAEMAKQEWWEASNPGLDIRISRKWVEHERTVEMGPRGFAVERLGIGDWPDTSEDADRVISRAAWDAAAEDDPSNRITGKPVFALDANPEQTWASIAIAGKRDDGLYQFAVVRHDRGTDWVVGVCQDLKANYSGCRFVIDKRGPLAEKIDALKRAHIRLIEASTEDYGRACGGFFASVTEGRSRYPFTQTQLALDEALAGACKGKLGDAWKWDRRNSTSADISPLVAVTLALWGAERAKRARAIDPNAILAAKN